MSFSRLIVSVAACALASAASALELAPLFQDHAVLQRDRPVPVWGRAAPGEHVTVSFAAQRVGATAGADGSWIAVLLPLSASASGADLSVVGKGAVTVHDVLVGDVWLCSGESNMEFTLSGRPPFRVENAAAEVAAARFPLIRQFKVARQVAPAAADTVGGDWKACSPETAGQFTAVGYFFARELFARFGVPVGLIDCSCAGSPIEAWMSPAGLAGVPGAIRSAAEVPGAARGWVPSGLFNGMIHPLLPAALRGVLWYQGESDVDRAASYAVLFPALITSWRSHFGADGLPFYWVQLENFAPASAPKGDHWAYFREAQSKALSLPSTGQAIAVDIGEAANPNPGNKREVGRRLALIAKADVYSVSVDSSGPVFARAAAEGPAMRVRFQFAGEGLTASGKPLQSFELAGIDRVFHPATAVIQGDSVVVQSPAVRQPVAVRYAWRNAPEANLFNGAGLPAAPFRSDDW